MPPSKRKEGNGYHQQLAGLGRFLGFRVRAPKARGLGQLAPTIPNPVSKNTRLAPKNFRNFFGHGRGRLWRHSKLSYYMQSKHPVIEGTIHIDIVTNSQTELPFNLSVQLVRQYDLRLAKFKGCCDLKMGINYNSHMCI